jgi:SAM-dependent methyltransferase
VIDASALEPAYPHTRDRDDISVWRCRRSGVYILSGSDHVHERFYEEKEHPELAALGDRDRVVAAHREDADRRVELIRGAITNKRWLDIGAGAGAILDRLAVGALEAAAVEPQRDFRTELASRGYAVYPDLADVESDRFDVATAFHVVEHFTRPLDELREARRALKSPGTLIVEVPHARDALIGLFESAAFRAHTFWSEHLVLHTRESLERLLIAAGFTDVVIKGTQRYPAANHLHWLSRGAPGGHQKWDFLRDPVLDRAYESVLSSIDATDTLVATAACGSDEASS